MPFKEPENLWILFLSLEHAGNLHLLKHSLYETKTACELTAKALKELYGPPLGSVCTKEYKI